MRLYRYEAARRGGAPRLALAGSAGSPIVDLLDAWRKAIGDPGIGDDFLVSASALIEAGPEAWERVAEVVTAATADAQVDVINDEVRLLAPLDRLASLRDFLAFEDHVKRGAERRGGEVSDYWYEAPVYYKGNHRSIIGPDDECPWPSYTEHLDFELELAAVIGRGGRDIAEGDAASHIFGFTVLNDFSARDIQAREMSAWLGPAKGKDFANALGPCIVTAEELGAEPDLEMICRVNGEEWGRARSSDMHWSWGRIVAHVSRDEDVLPGDVYGSGTPGGCCGLDLGRRLEPGDVVELEIVGIGILRNPIGRPRGRGPVAFIHR